MKMRYNKSMFRLKQLMDNLEEYKNEHGEFQFFIFSHFFIFLAVGDENAKIDSLNVPVETFQR